MVGEVEKGTVEGDGSMDITQMIALAEIAERERDMRGRMQSHELAESRHRGAARGLRGRIAWFAGAAFPRRATTGDCGATCAAC
jgi:hypothetical protein